MTSAHSPHPVLLLLADGADPDTRRLASERRLRVVFEDGEGADLMASPGGARELAVGFALTMGLLDGTAPPPRVTVDEQDGLVNVASPALRPLGDRTRASGGAWLGPLDARPVARTFSLEVATVLALPERMAERQDLFLSTGATHAAALFDETGLLLAAGEDVGRHNAFDKAVGALWLAGRLDRAAIATLSGRVSLEMVLKAARAGVAVLAGVSAPTAEAVAAAADLGLTLLGFCRDRAATLYTRPRHLARDGRPLPWT